MVHPETQLILNINNLSFKTKRQATSKPNEDKFSQNWG